MLINALVEQSPIAILVSNQSEVMVEHLQNVRALQAEVEAVQLIEVTREVALHRAEVAEVLAVEVDHRVEVDVVKH
jgi:hypothetical protein